MGVDDGYAQILHYVAGEPVRKEDVPDVGYGVQLKDPAEESHHPLHHNHLYLQLTLQQELCYRCIGLSKFFDDVDGQCLLGGLVESVEVVEEWGVGDQIGQCGEGSACGDIYLYSLLSYCRRSAPIKESPWMQPTSDRQRAKQPRMFDSFSRCYQSLWKTRSSGKVLGMSWAMVSIHRMILLAGSCTTSGFYSCFFSTVVPSGRGLCCLRGEGLMRACLQLACRLRWRASCWRSCEQALGVMAC